MNRRHFNLTINWLVLPSRSHWLKAISNARLLRPAGHTNIFVRKSMTREERTRDFQLRQQARELNRGKSTKEWVVYKGELRRTCDLSPRLSVGNH